MGGREVASWKSAPLPRRVALLKLPAIVMMRAKYVQMAVNTAASVPVPMDLKGRVQIESVILLESA
jgi:hypothetical protein